MVDIIYAVQTGDLAGVQTALAQGANPNMQGQDQLYLLHFAAMANQPQIFSLLVSHGAKINAKDPHFNEPLYYAARANGSKQFIDSIIAAGADINNQNKIGQTALHTAARLDSLGAVESLLINGANPNIKNIVGAIALQDAISTNHPDIILHLIEFGSNLQSKDNHNLNSFDYVKKASETIQDLFALPLLNNIQLPAHNHLLQAAVIDDVNGVQAEISKGTSASTTNSHGMTGVHYAALHGYPDMVKEFVNHGADINQTTHEGLQPIHIAAMAHQLNVVDTLINSHAAINAIDFQGNTPLHYGVQFGGSSDFITKLLDAGASIDAVNKQGQTALHLAVLDGNLPVVKVLVEHHANLTLHDAHGDTAADEAIKTNHADIATYLKEHNSDSKGVHKSEAIKLSDVISEYSVSDVLSESAPAHVSNASSVQNTVFIQDSVLPAIVTETVVL